MRKFLSRCIIISSMLLVVFYGVGVNVLPLCCLEEHEHLTLGQPHQCHHHCDNNEEMDNFHHSHHSGCCHLSRLVLQLSDVRTDVVHIAPVVFQCVLPQIHFNAILHLFDDTLTYCYASKAPPLLCNGRGRLLGKCCLII